MFAHFTYRDGDEEWVQLQKATKTYIANVEVGQAQAISDSMFPHVTVETVEIDDDGDQVIRLRADSQADIKQLEEWLQHDSRVRSWIPE